MKKISSILLIIVMLAAMTGCSAGSANDEMFAPNNGSAMDSVVSGDAAFGDSYYGKDETLQDGAPSINEGETDSEEYLERKIVYTVATELQTKDFDAAMALINSSINEYGGYIQSQKQTDSSGIGSKYSYRNVTMVARIPSEHLDAFLSGLKNDSIHTLSLSKDSKDYSTTYYDKEIRINNLKIQEERLLDMLSKATDLKTMLELEDRLTDVRYEIESLTKEMNIIDSNVNYSTVTIRMSEVVEYQPVVEEPATFFERIAEAFTESWSDFADGAQDFAVWFVYSLPTFLVLGAIAAVVVIIIKKRNGVLFARKRKAVKKPTEQAEIEHKGKEE